MSGALPAGALPPAPEPSLDILVVDGPVAFPSNTISPSSSQAGGDSHNGNDHLHSRAASTIPKDDSSFEKGSTGESVKVVAGASSASQKGPPTTTRTARAATRARTRATTTLQQLSQAVSRSRKMSPACVRSASPMPREFFPTPAFSLTSRESVKEMYEWYLRLARMQGPNSLILSRRRYEVAIAAITQVEVEEAERRERNLREGREE